MVSGGFGPGEARSFRGIGEFGVVSVAGSVEEAGGDVKLGDRACEAVEDVGELIVDAGRARWARRL